MPSNNPATRELLIWITVGISMAYKKNRLTPAEQAGLLYRLREQERDIGNEETSQKLAENAANEWADLLALPPWDQ